MKLKLENNETPVRIQKAFRMREDRAALLERLARAYDTSQTQIIEAMLDTYGEELIRDKKN